MNFFLNNLFIICDAPRAWGVYSQDSASPQMEALVELHDDIMFYLVIVLFGVGWILVSIIRNYVNSKSPISNEEFIHGSSEISIWFTVPALILILIAFPSFKLLYLMDEVTDPSLSALGGSPGSDVSEPYPLNVPEASDEAEIPLEIINPHPDDPDHNLTLLRNEVRVAYIENATISNMYRENTESVTPQEVDDSEQFFFNTQKELKRYLNDNYDGHFNLD